MFARGTSSMAYGTELRGGGNEVSCKEKSSESCQNFF